MNMKFGQVLKRRRKQKGISLRELDKTCGVNYSYISKLENGLIPTREVAKKLARALGASEDDFLVAAGYLPENSSPHTIAASRIDGYLNELPEEAQEDLINYVQYLKHKYGVSSKETTRDES